MPRYQVFHLTRSDLGDICRTKKTFFLSKSMRLMYRYLLFNARLSHDPKTGLFFCENFWILKTEPPPPSDFDEHGYFFFVRILKIFWPASPARKKSKTPLKIAFWDPKNPIFFGASRRILTNRVIFFARNPKIFLAGEAGQKKIQNTL